MAAFKSHARKHRLTAPPAIGNPGGGGGITEDTILSPAMVDRLFWRTGFGPRATDRAAWTGKSLGAAVDAILGAPAGTAGPEPTRDGKPLDPTTEDVDLVLSWVDRMIRSTNPFVERMAFFWHRLWANSRQDVSPPQLIMLQNDLFRRYSDLAANPDATFPQLAFDVTTDPSMLRYLTGESNVKGGPNENYAREIMELFCLGVRDRAGKDNYTESDVKNLARAFSGWSIDETDPNHPKAVFDQSRWSSGLTIVFGQPGNNRKAQDAVNLVLAQPAHPYYLVRRLWDEFIVSAPTDAELEAAVAVYGKAAGSPRKLKPLVRHLLTHPRLFESVDEPNMVKPPVVYVVGMYRALGLHVTDQTAYDFLDAMGQVPYFPPTVAGWEYGLAWLNTNTALARFSLAGDLVNDKSLAPDDQPFETAEEAFNRAWSAVGQPWLAPASRTQMVQFAGSTKKSTKAQRLGRQLLLRSMLLAGPDAQVM